MKRIRDFKVGHHYWMTGWTSQQKVRVEIVGFPEDGIANVRLIADKRNRGIKSDAIGDDVLWTNIALLGEEVTA
jgi:hypothetical protein